MGNFPQITNNICGKIVKHPWEILWVINTHITHDNICGKIVNAREKFGGKIFTHRVFIHRIILCEIRGKRPFSTDFTVGKTCLCSSVMWCITLKFYKINNHDMVYLVTIFFPSSYFSLSIPEIICYMSDQCMYNLQNGTNIIREISKKVKHINKHTHISMHES